MEPAGVTENVLRVTGVKKSYPGVTALDGVSLSLRRGEVRALMGKNGAGKSTLVKILSGATAPDEGKIELLGNLITFDGPADSLSAGIATVYQELNYVPGLTVAENITLGRWPSRKGIVDYSAMRREAMNALELLGEELDMAATAEDLSIAEQQICEIAHALSSNPKILILDEPTSSLPAHEVDRVIKVTRRLAAAGTAIIYVSHRMDEIARVADSVTVIRDGIEIATMSIDEAPVDHIARLMVGEEISLAGKTKTEPPRDDVMLRVSGLNAGERVNNIDLELKAGEVVGIAGLLGAGRSELLRTVAGADQKTSGSVEVFGERVDGSSVSSLIRRGVALVPEDRKAEGLVLDMPIAHNLVASCLGKIANKLGVLNSKREVDITDRSRASMDIAADDLNALTSSLSGGNQQKVVLGRCLNSGARILLLDEPTRGVDVQAKEQIYDLIARVASDGIGVVIVSSEYEELMRLCHRILVMRRGQFVDEIDPNHVGIDELLALILESGGPSAPPEAAPFPATP